MRHYNLLFQGLCDILRHEQSWKTSFEKVEQNKTALALSELLKKASANHDRSNSASTGFLKWGRTTKPDL